MNVNRIEIRSYVIIVECLHCGYENDGWIGDPRGANDIECENCKETFSIDSDAEVKIR